MFVCCECFVLSGRGLCDELITRPEESYQLWCVVVCDLENLKNEAMTRVGSQRHTKKENVDTNEVGITVIIIISKHIHMFLKHGSIIGLMMTRVETCRHICN
jgi:hypothetical protein